MKKLFITFISILLLVFTIVSSTFAWFIAKDHTVEMNIGGAYTSSYFDELSGNGLSPYFTGEIDGAGNKVGPYIISRPTHLYNLGKLQEMAENSIIGDENYYFQLGLPVEDNEIFYDENHNPDYQSTSEFKVYGDNTSSNYSIKLNMDNYVDNYALTPIGTLDRPFKSSFYGNGIVISNSHITSSNGQNTGLFGYVESDTILNGEKTEYVSTIKDFTMFNVSLKTSEANVLKESYVGFLVGYLNGCNLSNIGIYNGKMNLELNQQRTSPYKSDYGYIGKSLDYIFADEGSGGDYIDSSLNFTNIANDIVIQQGFAKKYDANGNLQSTMVSAFATGSVNLADIVPATSDSYDRNVFQISGAAMYNTKYSTDYIEYYKNKNVPFLDENGVQAKDPENPDVDLYLNDDNMTGFLGVSGTVTISFTTTGEGTFYFAYGVTSTRDEFEIKIVDSKGDTISSHAGSGLAAYSILAKSLPILEQDTYTVTITGSQFMYMRFYMNHERGDTGEGGKVSNIDFTYLVDGLPLAISNELFVNTETHIKFDLSLTTAINYIFNVTRNDNSNGILYYTSDTATIDVVKGNANFSNLII